MDDSAPRSDAGGVVRRRAASLRCLRARGDRFGTGAVAWRRGTPNEAGARGWCSPRHRWRGRKRLARGGRRTTSRAEGEKGRGLRVAGCGSTAESGGQRAEGEKSATLLITLCPLLATHNPQPSTLASAKSARETHDHSGGKGRRRRNSSNRGGQLCNWSGASPVYASRGSR